MQQASTQVRAIGPAWLEGLHLSCPADTISACLWDFCRTRPARVWPDLEMALAVLRGGALLWPTPALFWRPLAAPGSAASSAAGASMPEML